MVAGWKTRAGFGSRTPRLEHELRYLALLALLAGTVPGATSITIGEPELPTGDPFCGDCALSMHLEILFLEEEIGEAMEITELGWKRTPGGIGSASFTSFRIYMGYCSSDELGESFPDNFDPGTRIRVLDRPSYSISGEVEQWITQTLDTPFYYNGSGNLIIEYEWETGTGNVYIYGWATETGRGLLGGYGSSTGSPLMLAHYQQLIGELGLAPVSFGEAKLLFSE